MLTAIIRKNECIGCSRCIPACPVDAILGAKQQMHTVLIDECIGCRLCVEPCPVDCIDIKPLAEIIGENYDKHARAKKAKSRYLARQQRLAKEEPVKLPQFTSPLEKTNTIRQEIAESLNRVKNKSNKKDEEL